jgi:PAS domain S-box-containing protein
MNTEEEIFNKLIDAIQYMGDMGATIDEISKVVLIERHTLSKYLNRLRADGRLSYKQIGKAKIWFVSKAPLQPIFCLTEEEKTYTEKIFSRILSDMPEGLLILDFDSNILFMNQYLTALWGDCTGQKYYHIFSGSSNDGSGKDGSGLIMALIEGKVEEVESRGNDKEGRILDFKGRRIENPDGSSSIIAIIRDVTEKVGNEKRIKNLSELHRLLGESINRSYAIDQLCSTILKNLRDVIGFDMGDILIYDPDKDVLSSYAQMGYPYKNENIEEWKRKIAKEAINRKEIFFFDSSNKGMDKDEIARTAYSLTEKFDIQKMYAIPLKTKGEIHGSLLILFGPGRAISDEDRCLFEGISETIAGGIAKIKAEEEWRLKANVLEISSHPIFMTTIEGRLTYVNPALLKIWGYDKENEVLGRSWSEFWKDESEDVVTAVCEKGNWKGDLVAMKKDGSGYKTQLSASLIIGKKGPLQIVAIAEP